MLFKKCRYLFLCSYSSIAALTLPTALLDEPFNAVAPQASQATGVSLDSRINQVLSMTGDAYAPILHGVFYESVAAPYIASVERHGLLLDIDSLQAAHIFTGTVKSPSHRLYSVFARKIGLTSLIGRYFNLLYFAAANGDKARIQRQQQVIQAIAADKQLRHSLREVYDQASDLHLNFNLVCFFGREQLADLKQLGQDVDSILHPERLLPKFYVDWEKYRKGYSPAEDFLKKSPAAVGLMRTLYLEVDVLGYFNEIDTHWLKRLGDWWNSVKRVIPIHYVLPFVGAYNPTRAGLIPDPRNGMLYRGVNFFYSRVNALLHGSLSLALLGSERHALCYSHFLGWSSELARWGSYANTAFYVFYNGLLMPIEYTNRIYNIFTHHIPNAYASWLKATEEVRPLLRHIYQIQELIAQCYDTLSADQVLQQACKRQLDCMYLLLESDEVPHLDHLLHEIEVLLPKLQKPISFWTIFNPFNALPTKLIAVYKQLEGLPAGEEKIFKDAVASFFELEPLIHIAHQVYRSQQGFARQPYTLAALQEAADDKVHIELQGAYTPMIASRAIVPNDISVGGSAASQDNNILLTGLNGSGKSMFLRAVADVMYLVNTYGVAFAAHAAVSHIDAMRFYANVTDDAAKQQSLLMAEAACLNSVLQDLAPHKKTLIFIDELLKGTPQHEGTALMLAVLMKLSTLPHTTIFTSTHLTQIPQMAAHVGYEGFTYYTTEFLPEQGGFTYKIIPGCINKPAYLHILRKMHFDEEVFNQSLAILRKDPQYPFKKELPPAEQP